MRILSLLFTLVVLIISITACTSPFFASACLSDDNGDFMRNVESDLAREPRPDNHAAAITDSISGEDSSLNRRNQGTGSWNTIRVALSKVDLEDGSRYCQNNAQLRPNYLGQVASCRDVDVLTTEKRDRLNRLLDEMVQTIELSFKVNSLGAPLKVGSLSQCSGGFSIPSSHVSAGVSQADFVLYVAAGPTRDGVLGFAGGCQLETGRNAPRVIVGKMNINPRYLDAANERQMRSVILHEWMHAGGFIRSRFDQANIIQQKRFRGRSKLAIISPRALMTARNFFDCPSMDGVELEDESGSGTRENHLDPRVYREDLMAGVDFHHLSTIDLAIMEDLGVYRANYSNARPVIFGKNAGCLFLTSDCNTNAGGLGTQWCTPASGNVDCTSDFRGYGNCLSSPELSDGCSYYRADQKHCNENPGTFNIDNGESYGGDSRCFKTTGSFKNDSSSSSVTANSPRCFVSKCESGKMYFQVGSNSSHWYECGSAGASVQVDEFAGGNVTCPSSLTDSCRTLDASADQAVIPSVTNWTVFPKPTDAGSAGSVSASFVMIVILGLISLLV